MKFSIFIAFVASISSINAQTADPAVNSNSPIPEPTNVPTAPANTGLMTGIGDWIFDVPSEKAGSKPQLYKAGSVVRFEWHVQPANLSPPQTYKLQWRRGLWPDVTKFTDIVDTVANQGYLDWTIPDNFAQDEYILLLSTTQLQPQIRNRTSQKFKIYQGRKPINGELILPDSAESLSLSMVVGMACMIVPAWLMM